MFGEMKAACLLQNAMRRSASSMTAPEALEMVTIHGAKAVGRGHELGSIEPGKLADIVLLDMKQAHTTPAHNLVSNIVFAASPRNVDTVMIGGRIVLRNGKFETVDEGAILERAHLRATAIRRNLGLSDQQPWPVDATGG
jgi:5-methylthioadenosine/S-adenosylhomocysteine deaminase